VANRRKAKYIYKAPESAFFEEKSPGAGEKTRWRVVPPLAAAISMLLALIVLVFLNTYLVPTEATRQAVVSQTEVEPPYEVVAQWRPNGYVVLVIPSTSDGAGYVERWIVDANGEAALQNMILNDPRPAYGVFRAIGYGGIVFCLLAIASLVRKRKRSAVVVRRSRYTPPELGPR